MAAAWVPESAPCGALQCQCAPWVAHKFLLSNPCLILSGFVSAAPWQAVTMLLYKCNHCFWRKGINFRSKGFTPPLNILNYMDFRGNIFQGTKWQASEIQCQDGKMATNPDSAPASQTVGVSKLAQAAGAPHWAAAGSLMAFMWRLTPPARRPRGGWACAWCTTRGATGSHLSHAARRAAGRSRCAGG